MKFLEKLFGKKSDVPPIDIRKRFDLIGTTGQGSMSKVWRARDSKSGRQVALKVLDKDKTDKFEGRFDPKLKKPTEGEIAVQLEHPNIVKTYEWGRTFDGEQWLCMEFVEGAGLSYLVDAQNETMQKNRLDFAIQLGESIEYLHRKKWIHRDICPRNVIVSTEDVVKLIDFGLVVPNTPDFQQPGNRTGTLTYMAPELIKRKRTDERLDVFSYAVTVYEMYAGRRPWKSLKSTDTALKAYASEGTDIRELCPGIDEPVAAAITRGIERDPSDRWPDMTAMLEALRRARGE